MLTKWDRFRFARDAGQSILSSLLYALAPRPKLTPEEEEEMFKQNPTLREFDKIARGE